MRRLNYFVLCPFSRKTRLILREKNLDFTAVEEKLNHKTNEIEIEPSGNLPVLCDVLPHSEKEEILIVGSQPIAEYLDEVYPTPKILGDSPVERAEVRRLITWVEHKFFLQVTHPFLDEKILKRLKKAGSPDSMALRNAQQKLVQHFNYLSWLLSQRSCLSGETINGADFSVAAHISVLDYLGAIPWNRYKTIQAWYARIKSRPSFRPLLTDQIFGIVPPKHYAMLDF